MVSNVAGITISYLFSFVLYIASTQFDSFLCFKGWILQAQLCNHNFYYSTSGYHHIYAMIALHSIGAYFMLYFLWSKVYLAFNPTLQIATSYWIAIAN